MGYRRVIVGSDGSATAELAVREAAKLAAAFGAEVVIVTAYSPDPETAKAHDSAPEEIAYLVSDVHAAEELLAGAKAAALAAGAPKVRIHAESGDPATILINAAEELSGDLIVVGSVGMTSRFALGAVPNKVTHHAPCDVLIVQTAS